MPPRFLRQDFEAQDLMVEALGLVHIIGADACFDEVFDGGNTVLSLITGRHSQNVADYRPVGKENPSGCRQRSSRVVEAQRDGGQGHQAQQGGHAVLKPEDCALPGT